MASIIGYLYGTETYLMNYSDSPVVLLVRPN